MKRFLPLIQLLLLIHDAQGNTNNVIIHNASDLINLSNNVNNGTNYSGTTVLLSDDIDFSGDSSNTFSPIGKFINDTNHFAFMGTFDGQGHAVRNLKMNSSNDNVGFFGYSGKASIKSIVFDSSCSFISSGSRNNIDVTLGPISFFTGGENGCTIGNIVNMASITFYSSDTNHIIAGGIAGKIRSLSTVKNCANYGNIKISGSADNAYIGGLIGECIGGVNFYIVNNINYGDITIEKPGEEHIYVGGIVGHTQKTFSIESCVNIGNVETSGSGVILGGIVGYAYNATNSIINNSYWTNNGYNGYYYNEDTSNLQVNLERVDRLNETIINTLNSGNEDQGKWLLNADGCNVTFFIDSRVFFSSTSKMILVPSFEGSTEGIFDGWYIDNDYTEIFINSTISSNTNLYGLQRKNVTVTFDGNNGNTSFTSKNVTCGRNYGELPNAMLDGYTFNGWFTEISEGTEIKPNTSVTAPSDHTLYAHWTKITSSSTSFTDPIYVEIVFGRKDMSKEEVEQIIAKYTKDDFIIEKFVSGSETRVIIKFTNPTNANDFIESLQDSSDSTVAVTYIGFFVSSTVRLSPTILLLLFLSAFALIF